jgi:ubiquinone/menaquinone biosynthesis C-methylase UbiE
MRAMEYEQKYVLGSDPHELGRLDRQAAFIEAPTKLLLQASGLAEGMRVLDLGTGLGHVARLAAAIVGSAGAVVGLDRAPQALAVARQRAEAAGEEHVSFVEGDVARWRADEPFDAIVGRLVLFHMADPVAAVRHHIQNLRPGGLFVALDFDIGGARTVPALDVTDETIDWVMRAFSAAGASPRIGSRLGPILTEAGLGAVKTFGVQEYLAPDDPAGPALLTGVVRSLAEVITTRGIATDEQMNLTTLEQRIADGLRRDDAVFLPPTVVGAWGRRSSGGH